MADSWITIIVSVVIPLVGLLIVIVSFVLLDKLKERLIPITIGRITMHLSSFTLVFLVGVLLLGTAPYLFIRGYEAQIEETRKEIRISENQKIEAERILAGLRLYALSFRLDFPERPQISNRTVEAQVYLTRINEVYPNLVTCRASRDMGGEDYWLQMADLTLGDRMRIEIVDDQGIRWENNFEIEVPKIYLSMRRADH